MDAGRRKLCVGLLVGFWVLVAVGGTVNAGYRQYEDFVSSLASRGATQPWIGVVALLCVAAAHLVVVPLLSRQDRWVGRAVLVASVALVVVAAFRVQCPDAVYCRAADPVDGLDVTHGVGVLAYSLAMVVAMIRAGVVAVRIPARRLLGIASLAAASVFVLALVLTQGPLPGLSQRFWAVAGQVWLVTAASTPFATSPGMLRRSSRVRLVEHSTNREEAQ